MYPAVFLHSTTASHLRSRRPIAASETTGTWITYPVDEANPPALLIPATTEFTTMFNVEPIYAVELELPDAAEVSKMYTMKLVQGEVKGTIH